MARPRTALDESRGAISTLSMQAVALRSSLVMPLRSMERPAARYQGLREPVTRHSHLGGMSGEPTMDGDVGEHSPKVPPTVHAIATGSCLMMPSVMPDGREPVPTTSGSDVSRWGRPGMLAATGASKGLTKSP